MQARIEQQVLTDGSVAYNVLVGFEGDRGPSYRFACESELHANILAGRLNLVSWAEVVRGITWRDLDEKPLTVTHPAS
jgi:hypothetical protein